MRRAIIWGVCIAALAGTAVRLELRNRVPWNSVLEINLSGGMEEKAPVVAASMNSVNSGSDAITESDFVRAIDAARDDKRVSGLVLRIGDAKRDMGTLNEIAAHMAAFRKAGKAVVCAAVDEGDDVANIFAAACDKRISESVSMDEDMDEFFDGAFGEDNWSPIDVADYLKKVRNCG